MRKLITSIVPYVLLCVSLVHGFARPAAAELTIQTVAGNGKPDVVGQPFGVEVGPDGALYICDVQNHVILRQDRTTGEISTIAGTRSKGYAGDGGPATKARLNEPYELRFDKAGNLYVVERMNHAVRRIDAKTGIITTVAGNGEKKPPVDGGIATGRPMIGPRALFIVEDTLWIALREGHSLWSMNLVDGKLKHLGGTGKIGFAGDGADAKLAQMNGPKGVAVDLHGNIYIVDTENQTIRKVDGATNIITTIAGIGPKARGYGGDGGPATLAKLDRPHGVCIDAQGNVYIGDSNNHRVRKVSP